MRLRRLAPLDSAPVSMLPSKVRRGVRCTFSDLRAERDVLGSGALDLLLGRHGGILETTWSG